MTTDCDGITLLWFRQDLRISDNPALLRALENNRLLPVYILDDENAGDWAMGAASRVWLHHSLASLNKTLKGRLQFFSGDALKIIDRIVHSLPIREVYWNRCYEPWRIQRDQRIKKSLLEQGLTVESFNGSLLFEPWTIQKQDGNPYRVFTPYFRNAYAKLSPRIPMSPGSLSLYQKPLDFSCTLDQLKLLPDRNWGENMISHWNVGERAAQSRLREFLNSDLGAYSQARDFPATAGTSGLSPYLHFGEISPDQVCYALQQQQDEPGETDSFPFVRQLIWREFSHHLLYQFPQLPDRNFQPRFDGFEVTDNPEHLQRWQSGTTGFPIIDAGMRQLRQTGYMHNRVRMLVASFLIKNLGQSWKSGARWFWDNLVEADLANNSAGWQWCAGSGADAAPYFRIFNPLLQSEKFDKQGEYIARYCPELKDLSARTIHQPWNATDAELAAAGIKLGEDYARPMVDLKLTREAALSRYRALD